MRCVTEASALLAGVVVFGCTVYDCGGCALARVQFILCVVPLVAGTLIICCVLCKCAGCSLGVSLLCHAVCDCGGCFVGGCVDNLCEIMGSSKGSA